MSDDIYEKLWVRCREGQILRVSKIDKRRYCQLMDAKGNIVKGHEPAHTLETNFAIDVEGIDAE